MAGLPLLKLAGLLVKTLAKPVSNRLKVEAGRNPRLSSVCQTVGEFAHQIASRVNVLASGYKFIGAKPLPLDDAITKGVNFLSESFVFTVAGTIIVIEYYRSEEKNKEKAQKAAEKEAWEKSLLEDRFSSMEDRIQFLETRVRELDDKIEQQKTQLSLGSLLSIVPKNDTLDKYNHQVSNKSTYSWWKW